MHDAGGGKGKGGGKGGSADSVGVGRAVRSIIDSRKDACGRLRIFGTVTDEICNVMVGILLRQHVNNQRVR